MELIREPEPTPQSRAYPRGISLKILLGQIDNTIPFLTVDSSFADPSEPYLRILESSRALDAADQELSHLQYFEACIAAHWATVASFVPTDVDQQIRFRLWHPALPLSVIEAMAERVLEAKRWDARRLSTRFQHSPETGEGLSGHDGEWFSVAAAAYGALRKKAPASSEIIRAAIVSELEREANVFLDLERAKDGLGILRASTLIAHNLGDLDRVIEMWGLKETDPLHAAAFDVGNRKSDTLSSKHCEALLRAGNLNKKWMASENPRHFALRKPRGLRKSRDLLLPIGPFFDEWGAKTSRHPALTESDVGETVEALLDGWERLAGFPETPTWGYPRAIAGILSGFRGGLSSLSKSIPSRVSKALASGKLRPFLDLPQARFEAQWATRALKT